MARLNGWQRLWTVVSALALMIVVALAIFTWPTPRAFIVRGPDGHRYRVTGPAVATDDDAFLEVMHQLAGTVVNMPDGQSVAMPQDADPALIARLKHFLESQSPQPIVQRESSWPVRGRFVGIAVGVWAACCAGIYAIGWSVGWIRRGFSRA
jgi:hypothetical protein